MELIKENVTVCRTAAKGREQIMTDGDIIVPDINPDILKVLQLDASACVTEKRAERGRVRINGRLDLKILYIPDSERDKIKSIVTSFDFTSSADNPDIEEGMTVFASADADRAEFTLTNSRKMHVRAVVGIEYEVLTEDELEIPTELASDDNSDDNSDCGAQILYESVNIQNSAGLCEAEFSVKEETELTQSRLGVCELLKTDAKISGCEYKTVSGKVVAKGDVTVCALYTDEDGAIHSAEVGIPFTEVFECSEAGDETRCDIDYDITDVQCEIIEDSDGEKRVFSCEISVRAQIRASENVTLNMIGDCYKPRCRTRLLKEETEIEEIVARPSDISTLREVMLPPQGAPGVSGVYDVITKANITKAQLKNKKLYVEGKTEVCVLYLTDSAENPVYSVKKDIPISLALDCENGADSDSVQLKAAVPHSDYSLNGAGEIEIRCNVSIDACVVRKRKIELICDAVTEEDENKRSGIVIYFAQGGDNLWSIAKHYAVEQSKISEMNNLEDNKIESGTRLIIPNV